MNARQFVRYAKSHAVDDPVNAINRELVSPRTLPQSELNRETRPEIAERLDHRQKIKQIRSEWFAGLGREGQQMLSELLQESSELTLLNLFALIDGVGGEYEGVFEIVAVAQDERTVINPENTEMLHDLLSEICEEDRNV